VGREPHRPVGGDAERSEPREVLPALIGVAGVSVPPLVHSLQRDSSGGVRSLVGMLGASGAGALSGVAIGSHRARRRMNAPPV
jgi:hypothetical protein